MASHLFCYKVHSAIYKQNKSTNNRCSFHSLSDEICLDPSDAPLEIALNAKKNPRFVLRLDIKKPSQTTVIPNGEEVTDKALLLNGTASSNSTVKPISPIPSQSPSPSKASVWSTGSDNSSTSSSPGQAYAGHDSQTPGKNPFTRFKSPAQNTKIINDKMPSSSKGQNVRNFLSSPRKGFGMFFDGVGSHPDQSSHAAHKMARTRHKRKGSLGRLKIKKKEAEKNHTELSTEQLAPGILKVFGDHVSPGSNYKSVRATELTSADEIVKQALERYSLTTEKASDYVLCDVIGYFAKRTGDVNVKNPEEDADKWETEYARVISDKEKPLVLQQLWKPIGGFSRRFELRRRVETQDSSFFKPRGSVAVMKVASVRGTHVPVTWKENQQDKGASDMSQSSSTGEHFPSMSVEEGGSSGRASLIQSPFIAPMDTPYLLLLKGSSNHDDFLYHRLDEQLALVGRPVYHLDDQSPDIVLFAPDVLPQHCTLSKRVETSAPNFEQDYNVNFVIYLEPCRGADVCINGVTVSSSSTLHPGDLVSFGKHYLFMFKDPSQVADTSMKLTWFNNLKQFHKLQMSANASKSHRLKSNAVDVVDIQDEPSNELRLSYLPHDEDDLLDMIMNIVDLSADGYKLTPSYLLIMCIEHSARYHTELQTRQLLIKISNAIQTVASVSSSFILYVKYFVPNDSCSMFVHIFGCGHGYEAPLKLF